MTRSENQSCIGFCLDHKHLFPLNHKTYSRCTLSNLVLATCLLFPLFLSPRSSPFGKMGQSKEVCHFSFTIDQSTEHRVISARRTEKQECNNQQYEVINERKMKFRKTEMVLGRQKQAVTWQRRKQCQGLECLSLGSRP